MQKVLIIGGSGFMGSHTADELTRQGYEVTILDVKKSEWLLPNQKMVIGSILDLNFLEQAMSEIDYIYYFAGISDITEAKKNPSHTIEANVTYLVKVLEMAVKKKIKRFIYASTMYVYSNFGSFYRASKQSAEIFIETFAEEYGLEFSFLRYGSLYGPRAQDWNGIRKFVEKIINDHYLEYDGDGAEVREYIHVHDAARLSVDVLHNEYINKAVTITGQQVTKIEDLITIIFEITGIPKKVLFKGASFRKNNYGKTPYRYKPQVSTKLVPFEFVDLGQGLLNVIEEVYLDKDRRTY